MRQSYAQFQHGKRILCRAAGKGTWSLHVTRNWRLTFWIDEDEKEICDVNFEDYH